jgi:hypothetical protein
MRSFETCTVDESENTRTIKGARLVQRQYAALTAGLLSIVCPATLLSDLLFINRGFQKPRLFAAKYGSPQSLATAKPGLKEVSLSEPSSTTTCTTATSTSSN